MLNYVQYFDSNIVEGVAESWAETEMSWVEVDVAGWSWVELSARFSNTHEKIAKYSRINRQTDHGHTELDNMLVNKTVLNEINKKEHSLKVSNTERRLKGKYLKI